MASLSSGLEPDRRGRRNLGRLRGATLFETVIALFIFSTLVLGATLTLITEAGRRLQHSGERAGDLAAGRVIDRLRTDVWASRDFAVPLDYDPIDPWYEGPLVLQGHGSGYDMAYGVVDGALQRAIRRPGRPPEIDELLHGVYKFRWRFLDGVSRRTIELEVQHSETATFRGPGGAPASPTLIAERVVLSPRRIQAWQW